MRGLNLEQLRSFVAVVRSGGVVKASRVLNISQPAVTARIKNLEQTLGTSLFDRGATGLRLTKRGELLLNHANRIEALADQIERDIVDPNGVDGHLRIGASETIAQSWLPDFVGRLHAQFPKVQIEFNVEVSVNLRDALLAREIDLAFLLGPVSEHSIENLSLPSFALGWFVSSAVHEDPSGAKRLFDKPVITYARRTRPFRELRDSVRERVGPDVPMFPSSSLSAALRLVESGLGVSALPLFLARPSVDVGNIRPFDPGWTPKPLTFTASYVADPASHLVSTAADAAVEVANRWAHRNN